MHDVERFAADEAADRAVEWRLFVSTVYWKERSKTTMPETTAAQIRTGRDIVSVVAALHKSVETAGVSVFTVDLVLPVDSVHATPVTHDDTDVVDEPLVVVTFYNRKSIKFYVTFLERIYLLEILIPFSLILQTRYRAKSVFNFMSTKYMGPIFRPHKGAPLSCRKRSFSKSDGLMYKILRRTARFWRFGFSAVGVNVGFSCKKTCGPCERCRDDV
jgi:hypothetical protein